MVPGNARLLCYTGCLYCFVTYVRLLKSDLIIIYKYFVGSVLLAGIPQEIYLSIFTGHYTINSQDTLSIQTLGRLHALHADEVDGYSVKTEDSGATVTLPDIAPFQTKEYVLRVMTSLTDVGAETEEEEEEELSEQKVKLNPMIHLCYSVNRR